MSEAFNERAFDQQKARAETAELELKVALSIGRKAENRVAELEAALERMVEGLNVHAVYYAGRGGKLRLSREFDHIAEIGRRALSPPKDKP